jgi:hypothetical protein
LGEKTNKNENENWGKKQTKTKMKIGEKISFCTNLINFW